MKKKLVIFGTGEIANITFEQFKNYSDYEVVSFAVDKKYIKGENFNNLPLIPFEEIENKYQLTEITIRTGAIGMWLGFVKKWANRIDSLAASMRQKASELDRADTLEKRNKIDKELWTIKSDSDKALRSMSMYGSLISAAGGLGAVKNYKEIKKQLSKRRK